MAFHLPITSPERAVSAIQSGNRVFIHSVSQTPHTLINAMVARADELRDVEICHMHTEGPLPYLDRQYQASFRPNSFFIGANMRKQLAEGIGDYVPIFLSEIHLLFQRNILPIDVALIQVSPPDEHGYCSLGASVDISLAAIHSAKYVIAQINPRVPRTHGDGLIPVSLLHAAVEVDTPIYEVLPAPISDLDRKIGRYIAGLVDDGATLQLGIGGIPNATVAELVHHKRLGIHTEMFSDGVIDLIERGVVTGEHKTVLPYRVVSSFVMGSQRVYDFINDNPGVAMKQTSFTNDTAIIRRNPRVTAINSAIEIDLTGQVCADTIGTYQYSGVGGQMDFVRGATLSEGGKPIIALASTTSKGESKIVPFLKEGAGVTTTRAHVHYIVTEYGIADLYGKNLRQRARALIDIAHPDHRETLERKAHERFK
ncbi:MULTISPECIES: acetyl-CoA hydrolase/transferase C-terminal domain-containing protein [unclassified Spirosoma]|uniref:acetyl-CoA hydrolase/transferase family protein n=1 Tax=unclassified Spirosoma TaxID=2621999 RepID=UPI000965C858|nr:MULTISPECIES: acetyl-CoA hydrolase/transferase C-terminal domain-containing protein [unclassified Spirosoma]MBN8821538.1 acetyl-CoA hydrolase/transferase family protein [Spirosoma sp.]OJW78314.1 MAG: 4-hydroxybutyrate CoA-transferase [Spirosoma sp. 48-14]